MHAHWSGACRRQQTRATLCRPPPTHPPHPPPPRHTTHTTHIHTHNTHAHIHPHTTHTHAHTHAHRTANPWMLTNHRLSLAIGHVQEHVDANKQGPYSVAPRPPTSRTLPPPHTHIHTQNNTHSHAHTHPPTHPHTHTHTHTTTNPWVLTNHRLSLAIGHEKGKQFGTHTCRHHLELCWARPLLIQAICT
jgi:hypothetical protein